MMRKMLLIGILTFGAAFPASAQDSSDRFSGFALYSGTEAVGTFSEGSATKTVGGFAGASWSHGRLYTAVEAQAAIGLGFAEDLGSAFEPHRTASLSALAGVHASPNLILYGRIGAAYAHLRARRAGTIDHEHATGLRLGVGADYRITPNYRLRSELGRNYLGGVDAERLEQTEIRFALVRRF
ncbi:outer membrane beta-barrel protein [Algicella marina]|uniref:Outer membrane beta-barrel protein n=1 Tax=Algicella marina TaxID=2683284 RepID=A0A6P1T1N9_9RHOB|nr:outer membrane beta-barrel protein [Algicella marina]QHQ35651.1 outer membrane beta-barrel protein [Algicella marina]